MAMTSVDVFEKFISIQGESTFAGLGCFFVRLAGCNLRCGYCDTERALVAAGNFVDVDVLVSEVTASCVPLVEITGGEPLLQAGFVELASKLVKNSGKMVLVETNGSLDLSVIPDGAVAIVDVKSPGSGAGNSFELENLARLREYDELKFVLVDRDDYEWARGFVAKHGLVEKVRAVHFSPVARNPGLQQGSMTGGLDAAAVGEWILEDGLGVRLQVQLHRVVGME